MTLGEFAEAAAQYCLMMDGSVTSWGRTTKRNTAVGGAKMSGHRFFRGLDVVYDDPTMLQADHPTYPDGVRIIIARRLGLKLIPERDHDHLQPLDWEAG
jgi:hypothetical protein